MSSTFIKFHEVSALIFKVIDDSARFFFRWVRGGVQEGVLKGRRMLSTIFILLRTKKP